METTGEHEKENLHEALLPEISGAETELSGAEALPSHALHTASGASASNSLFSDGKDTEAPPDQIAIDSHSSMENKMMCQPLISSFTRASQINIEMDTIVTVEVNQQNRPERDSRSLSTSVLSTTSDGAICRICHDGEENEDLLSPCHCTGTVGLLHLSCLEKWLGSSSRTRCELCGFEYTVDTQPKPFIEWVRHPSSVSDRRNVICDMCCFFLLTPLATISSWLCLVGAKYYSYWTGRWEVPGLISLTIFLIFIYLTWCLVVVRYHYRIWLEWRRHNQIVRIRAVRRGNVVRRNLTSSTGSQLLNCDSSLRSRTSPVREPQAEDNNNNASILLVDEEEEEDVIVEVTGGAGQRGSYRLLSDSSNLVCSPNKLPRHRHSSSSSQRSKLHSTSFSPSRPNPRNSSTSSAEGEITAPLLGATSGREPSWGRQCVSRSLMLDPGFSEPQSMSVHSTVVTYQHITDDVFTTLTDPDRFTRKTGRVKESFV